MEPTASKEEGKENDSELLSLRAEYTKLFAEVKELENVYYLLKLEITSLSCEKDFLLSSLDEIDALIYKKQEESGHKGTDTNLKRSGPTDESLTAKKRITESESIDSAPVPTPEVKKEDVTPPPGKQTDSLSPSTDYNASSLQKPYFDPKKYGGYPYQPNPYAPLPSNPPAGTMRFPYGSQLQHLDGQPLTQPFAPNPPYVQMLPLVNQANYGNDGRYPIPPGSFSVLSPQSPYYYVNPTQQIDRPHDLNDPYVAIPVPRTSAPGTAPFVPSPSK